MDFLHLQCPWDRNLHAQEIKESFLIIKLKSLQTKCSPFKASYHIAHSRQTKPDIKKICIVLVFKYIAQEMGEPWPVLSSPKKLKDMSLPPYQLKINHHDTPALKISNSLRGKKRHWKQASKQAGHLLIMVAERVCEAKFGNVHQFGFCIPSWQRKATRSHKRKRAGGGGGGEKTEPNTQENHQEKSKGGEDWGWIEGKG